MGITDILSLLGGLALFLYGMHMMSNGLEAAAGNRMKSILEKLTSNRIKGVLVGAVITAVIQSSSATTVMLVGFRSDDIKSGSLGNHGCKYRYNDHRSVDRTGYLGNRSDFCNRRCSCDDVH